MRQATIVGAGIRVIYVRVFAKRLYALSGE
jgi:hypothetical protein